ncbi:glycosyl transferase [Microbacterium sp. JZ37]|uniref:glycosyl transferase n=1 Tax=Microbacterium sp. JZ37 TaxID=2654193 RepID=UPI002B498B69|nr:glycosyl transferase [Microbacterium sp. JZ37]WRH17566.1 glycosyl transferase [Microbacterium sp. JZ37]
MRFVWAVLAFVLAAASFGAGLAQRTVFLGPESAEQTVSVDEELPYLVIDGDAFALRPGAQTLTVRGEGPLYTAYGRTADLEAWLSDQRYNRVSAGDGDELVTSVVEPEVEPTDGTEGRNPQGSDLWIEEQTAEDEIVRTDQLPEGMSMLVAVDGSQPAPSDVSIVWPLDQKTPWFGPLMVLGGIFLVTGLVLYILALRHTRRRRGPIRKGPALPPAEGDDDGASKGVISTSRRGRRALVAVPALGLSVGLLAGCTADSWPELGGAPTPTPTPTATATLAPDQQPSSLTEAQADRIVGEISETVAAADESLDIDLASHRLSGLALETREVNYRLRAEIEDYPQAVSIPTGPASIVLPQAVEGWPRTALLIVADEDDTTVAPTILSMTQDDPWSRYRVTYLANLEAAAETPQLAPAWLGAALVAPDSPFLALAPDQVAAAYADIIGRGEESEYAELFDISNDGFLTAVAEKRQATIDSFNETGAETGTIEYAQGANPTPPIALATLDSGAIVAVGVDETETVRPTNEDAVIRFEDDAALSLLTGETESPTGVETRYTDQLFFFVPAQGSDERIRLLGYTSAIQSAELLPEPEDAEASEGDADAPEGE